MSKRSYGSSLLDHWGTVAACAFAGLVVSLLVSFLQPLQYSSTVRLLVRQDIGSAVDAYTASRSEERIADNLTNVLYTTTFFNDVLNAGYAIDERTFPAEDYKRRRAWGKTVSATVARGSGLMTVVAYHEDVAQAQQIVRAVAQVMTTRASDYTSAGSVNVRLIDDPLNSRWPVRPNIPANGLSGLVLGGLFGVAYVLLKAERTRRRHQLIHEEF